MHSWILFWGVLTAACVIWYSSVTIYVTIKGAKDIKDMLRHLSEMQNNEPTDEL